VEKADGNFTIQPGGGGACAIANPQISAVGLKF
jgi:hypothetical protein